MNLNHLNNQEHSSINLAVYLTVKSWKIFACVFGGLELNLYSQITINEWNGLLRVQIIPSHHIISWMQKRKRNGQIRKRKENHPKSESAGVQQLCWNGFSRLHLHFLRQSFCFLWRNTEKAFGLVQISCENLGPHSQRILALKLAPTSVKR